MCQNCKHLVKFIPNFKFELVLFELSVAGNCQTDFLDSHICLIILEVDFVNLKFVAKSELFLY